LLAFLLTITCLTTAVGLVAAFAQDFHKHFPQVSYHAWLALSCLASFLAANFGLDSLNRKATITSVALMATRALETFHPVSSDTINIDRSIGFGAMFECK